MKRNKITIIITLFGCYLYFSCNNTTSNENLDDIKKIKKGMHFNQVSKIMRNAPCKQDTYAFEPDEFVIFYQSPIGSSGDFSITFGKNDSIVKRIYKGD